MATVVAQTVGGRVCSAQILLPALVNGRVIAPGIVPADILVFEVAAVGGGIGHPEGGFIGFVVEEAIVPDHLAVIRIGVNDHLLVGIGSIVAAGLCAAVGFGECVVAVAPCVEGVACTHRRSLRSRHLVVREPGVKASCCEVHGAAVEGADT